jgi:hypothetical protein
MAVLALALSLLGLLLLVMFGFRLGFGLRRLVLQLDQSSGQTLQVSRPTLAPNPDATVFSMMIGSTHINRPPFRSTPDRKKTQRAPHPFKKGVLQK